MGTVKLAQPFAVAHTSVPPLPALQTNDIDQTRTLLDGARHIKKQFPNGLGHEQWNLLSCTGSDRALYMALCAFEIGRLDALGVKPQDRAAHPGVTTFDPAIWDEAQARIDERHRSFLLLHLYGMAVQLDHVEQVFPNPRDADALRHNIECLGGDTKPLPQACASINVPTYDLFKPAR